MRRLIFASLILVMDVFVFGQTKAVVHEAEREKDPLTIDKVPEAVTGFRSPVDFNSSLAGYDFLQKTDATGRNAYPVTCIPGRSLYHPGWDMNKADGDKNEPVYAAADVLMARLFDHQKMVCPHRKPSF